MTRVVRKDRAQEHVASVVTEDTTIKTESGSLPVYKGFMVVEIGGGACVYTPKNFRETFSVIGEPMKCGCNRPDVPALKGDEEPVLGI